jgi:hypothetical protein
VKRHGSENKASLPRSSDAYPLLRQCPSFWPTRRCETAPRTRSLASGAQEEPIYVKRHKGTTLLTSDANGPGLPRGGMPPIVCAVSRGSWTRRPLLQVHRWCSEGLINDKRWQRPYRCGGETNAVSRLMTFRWCAPDLVRNMTCSALESALV